jgi:dATP pyrophosphohydrolase
MAFKLPRSIQVVVFAELNDNREFLLLKRIDEHGGFWQSVTGSIEEGEGPLQAAVREVREETGIVVFEHQLIDLGLTNIFEIAPQWRNRYAPGITHNEEVCFAVETARALEVRLDPREHDAYAWVDYETAMSRLYWESSIRALRIVGRG